MEKHIEELAQVIQNTYFPITRGADTVGERYLYPNDAFRLAETLYEAGYKKTTNKQVVEVPETGIGDLSDGYHTFNELYHHRAVLFSVLCNMFPEKAWKSKKHHEGDMFEGMFIVGIDTPEGQATYHYDIDPYWDMFKVKELDTAPKWDGHSAEEAINRISKLSNKQAVWRLETDEECPNPMFKLVVCSNCKELANNTYKFCPHCGCEMSKLTTEGVKFS